MTLNGRVSGGNKGMSMYVQIHVTYPDWLFESCVVVHVDDDEQLLLLLLTPTLIMTRRRKGGGGSSVGGEENISYTVDYFFYLN